MWIVRLALTRPYTFLVLALVILLTSPLVVRKTPVDVLPEINIPVITVIWQYGGLSPREMEQRYTNQYERNLTATVNDIEHIESQTLPGTALIRVYFRPGGNVQVALSQITAISQTNLRALPPGTTPPLIVIYSATTVPVLQLALSGNNLTEQVLNDVAQTYIRSQLATVNGAAVPYPFGGKARVVSVDLDMTALQSLGLAPYDVVNAIGQQNLVLPSGTAKFGPREFPIESNASPDSIAAFADIPVRNRNGALIRVRDVASVHDGYTPQTNVVRLDGQRGALLSMYKTGGASTIDIVDEVLAKLPKIMTGAPVPIVISPLFDQSLFVRAAVSGVVREGMVAALLTAAMILLFLGSLRSTLIIAVSIPLSVLCSLMALSALGETINLMTLGGLSLAVGILVDDATVTIENIERHLAMGKDLRSAILDGAQQIAIPAFVSTLCICIVLAPMFFLAGIARYLFVPLAEAVVFAMLASYLLSRTLVPTLAMYLLSAEQHEHGPKGPLAGIQRGFQAGFERLRSVYHRLLRMLVLHSRAVAIAFALICATAVPMALLLGTDFFPGVDAGQIRLHMRAPGGTRIEETMRLVDEVGNVIRETIPPQDLAHVLDNAGLPYSQLNTSFSNSGTIGPIDAEILIALRPDRHGSTRSYMRRLRLELAERFPGVSFFFQPADIVSQILNFGVPAPIDLQVVGLDREHNYDLAQGLARKVAAIPGAVDVRVQQVARAPGFFVNIDREGAQTLGLTAQDVAQTLQLGLASSAQVSPSFWVNPQNGIPYTVAVQWPQYRVESLETIRNLPVVARDGSSQTLGNVARISNRSTPALISHYDVQPVFNVYASVEGSDLGAVARQIERLMPGVKDLPKGTEVRLRGQVSAMEASYRGLAVGIFVAIVLVYLLLVVNFQSWLDPLIIITALPGALVGIVWTLLITHTHLSVPALTGAIMCMGVATANSVLVVSFARELLLEGVAATEAAIEAGYTRIRPVIMTAIAMLVGMLPLALGLGEGGEQNAPLGRAVIGGLVFATAATLLVVPCMFALLHSRRPTRPAPALPEVLHV
jgi:multidrug efflux pump subunit AcrB